MSDSVIKQLEEVSRPPEKSREPQMDLLDILVAIVKHRRMILRSVAIAFVLATALALLLPAKYEATAKLLPPTQNQSGPSAMLNQLAGMQGSAASALLGTAFNAKNLSDVYVAMLKSRTIQDKLIDRFDLRKRYSTKTYTDARKKLEDNTEIKSGKEGVITVSVEDRDPQLSKEITEAYVNEVLALSENLAISEASQRRLYFEKQFEQEKGRLADAEIELKRTQQATGMIVPGEQAKAIVGGIAQVRGMIAAKQVQISAMRSYATEQNPQLVQAQRELQELWAQLRQMEKGEGPERGTSVMSAGKLPEASLEFLRKYRDFKYHETLFEILAKQYELARLDEAKDLAMIQVLDTPVVPDKRSGPRRLLIVASSVLATALIACIIAFLRESRRLRPYSPEQAEKLAFIRRAWLRRA
jgi:tyrosine-protein kinase Etk/Wzc